MQDDGEKRDTPVIRPNEVFVGRENEIRLVNDAIRDRKNLVICGPAGIGKTALVSQVIYRLPEESNLHCVYVPYMKDLHDMLRQLIRVLYEAKDPNLRRQLHAQGISVLSFDGWLKRLSSSALKGFLYRTVERGDYRVFLDHLPPLTLPVAKIIKELFWMRNTPVYLLVRDEMEQHLYQFYSFFYWGERERLMLQPLSHQSATELLDGCISRFGLSELDLSDFREETLELSKRVPGAIVKMCALAADPHYQYGSRIKMKSVYIEYLMSGHGLSGQRLPRT
ncbi:MAG TPA: ATP-binding protein [Terriglobales bacterium]|nr:ATP-binding protein [Terriglobales bacterium]